MSKSLFNKPLFLRYPTLRSRIYALIRARLLHLEEVNKQLPSQGVIYDIGCGYGITTYFLATGNQKRRIVGIDIDSKRIENARKAFLDVSNISFLKRDISTDTDIPQVDGVLVYDLLHHIPIQVHHKLLCSIYRSLKTGGVAVIKEIDTRPIAKMIFTYLLDMTVTGFQPVYYRESQSLACDLREIGFSVSVKKIRSILPYPHYMIVCRKKTQQD